MLHSKFKFNFHFIKLNLLIPLSSKFKMKETEEEVIKKFFAANIHAIIYAFLN